MLPSKGGFKGGLRGTLDFSKYLIFKNTKLACTVNEISLTADFQSLSLAYSNFVPYKAPDSISEHAFFKNFLGACPHTT